MPAIDVSALISNLTWPSILLAMYDAIENCCVSNCKVISCSRRFETKKVKIQMLHKNSSSTNTVIFMFRGKELKESGLFSTILEYHGKREHINYRFADRELF
jgi:hypothetical protein